MDSCVCKSSIIVDKFNELFGNGWGGGWGDCYGKCSRHIVHQVIEASTSWSKHVHGSAHEGGVLSSWPMAWVPTHVDCNKERACGNNKVLDFYAYSVVCVALSCLFVWRLL